jgi:hypothetical protein
MFIDNSIAMSGSSFDDRYINDKTIIVFDNEPRSEQICTKIQAAITKGYRISLFPSSIEQKDVNDMILAGIESVDIREQLLYNACRGLQAQLKFNNWKRV